MLGLEALDEPDADDPSFLSPKLTINQRQESFLEYSENFSEAPVGHYDYWVMKADRVERTVCILDY